jgi:hypothetical protein
MPICTSLISAGLLLSLAVVASQETGCSATGSAFALSPQGYSTSVDQVNQPLFHRGSGRREGVAQCATS